MSGTGLHSQPSVFWVAMTMILPEYALALGMFILLVYALALGMARAMI